MKLDENNEKQLTCKWTLFTEFPFYLREIDNAVGIRENHEFYEF